MANPEKITSKEALYLYGVSRATGKKAGKAPGRISSPGIDGVSAVKAIPSGDFVCWVSDVDHATFAEAMERNMENLEWLALHGVRHQQVVGEVAAQAPIIPARFGTIFSSEEALLKNVLGRSGALAKVFERVADADEWGVKVFAEKTAKPMAVSTARSGKEYLQQKASQIKPRQQRSDPELQELAAALGEVATDSAPSGKVSGAQPNLLWQATFLVARGRRKQWERVLNEYVERWDGLRRIEVNGPWPPYSFVSDAD